MNFSIALVFLSYLKKIIPSSSNKHESKNDDHKKLLNVIQFSPL